MLNNSNQFISTYKNPETFVPGFNINIYEKIYFLMILNVSVVLSEVTFTM